MPPPRSCSMSNVTNVTLLHRIVGSRSAGSPGCRVGSRRIRLLIYCRLHSGTSGLPILAVTVSMRCNFLAGRFSIHSSSRAIISTMALCGSRSSPFLPLLLPRGFRALIWDLPQATSLLDNGIALISRPEIHLTTTYSSLLHSGLSASNYIRISSTLASRWFGRCNNGRM